MMAWFPALTNFLFWLPPLAASAPPIAWTRRQLTSAGTKMKGSHFGLMRDRDGFSAVVRCLSVKYIEMQVNVGARTMAHISV